MLFESRERDLAAVGQNKADHQLITAARHKKWVQATLKYEWINKADPLCWLADAVVGATNAAIQGDKTFVGLINRYERVDI